MSNEIPGVSALHVEEQQQPMLLPELRRQSVKVVCRETRRRSLKGPMRALRLCLLSILLPGVLVAVPLYMRYHVYAEQLYPVGMSDMRLLDGRVSTTWCQRQLVRANTTFNAFLLAEKPEVEPEPVRLTMTRHLELDDDMKEYWAFYLLRGSSITVSTCVRYPGASLIVIRGHKHLHECAYIGDDSSEELEELEAAAGSGHWPRENTSDNSNEPETMRRARPGVVFHGGQEPLAPDEQLAHVSAEDDADAVIGKFMGKVTQNRGKVMPEVARGPEHRQLTTDDGGDYRTRHGVEDGGSNGDGSVKYRVNSEGGQSSEDRESEASENSGMANSRTLKTPQNVTVDPTANATAQSSSEVFEDVLKKIQQLGPRGKDVLNRLNKKLGGDEVRTRDDGLDVLRQMVRDVLREQEAAETLRGRHHAKRSKLHGQEERVKQQEARRRRHLTLSSSLHDALARNDEEDDAAFEDGMEPDGIAEHHETLNETTDHDFSKSEYWSSFSSSEEALLNCAGLILNLPLTPHLRCQKHRHDGDLAAAAEVNKLTYRVPTNGYYFFVFNSENEKQQNFIRAHFTLDKVVYNVTHPLAACRNSTEACALPLHFFSSEKVVLELPVRTNDSLWNEEFVAVSTCEPRTALYLVCVIAVPLLILLFAFQ